jgi:hypothetical protein
MAAAKPVSDVDDENDDDEDKLGILAAAADCAVPAAPNDDSVLWLRDGTSVPFTRTADKRFACPLPGCVRTTGAAAGEPFVLATKVALIEHLQSKHGWTHYARFPCTEHGCGRAFAFAAKLKAHAITHDESKRAEAAARRKAKEDAARAALGVAKHSKTVVRRAVQTEIVDGVEKFPCPLPGCTASFTSYYLVNKHRKRDHGDDERLDPTRPPPPKPEHTHKRQRREGVATCACEYCDKPCVTASDRVAHYRSCHAALRVFDAALPSDDLRACLRIIQRLPGTHKAPLAAMMSNDDDDDVKDDDDDDVEDDDVHKDDDDDAGAGVCDDDENVGSDVDSDEDDDEDDVGVPSGLTKSIASAIVLYRVSASGEPLQLRCSVAMCDVITNTCNAHACHVRAVHGPKRTVAFACDHCAYTSTSQGRLRVHVRDVHRTTRPYLCSASATCSAAFKTRGDMRKHAATVHADASDAVSCRICSKACRSERALANHMFVHAPRKHVCAACGDAFTFPSKLRKHARLHPSGDGFFTCSAPACNGKFMLYDQLRWHEILEHGAPAVPCTVCKLVFVSRASADRHASRLHADSTASLPYTPGASDGERVIWRALTAASVRFRTEVHVINQMRLDFALCWSDGNMCCAIEYDGAFHFVPSSRTAERAWELLRQIQRDNEKTRRLRAAGVPLVRMQQDISEIDVLEAAMRALCMLRESASASTSASDFVCPAAFECAVAQQVRDHIAAGSCSGGEDLRAATQHVLSKLPRMDAIASDVTAQEASRHAEGALTMFLRCHAESASVDGATLEALAQLARHVPHVLHAAPALQRQALTPAQEAFVDDVLAHLARQIYGLRNPARDQTSPAPAGARAAAAMPNMRPGTFYCWFDGCTAFFNTTGTERAFNKALLRHLQAAHGDVIRVRCAFAGCTATATNREELQQHMQLAHFGHAKEDSRRMFCAAPSCAAFPLFSKWWLFFRHANLHHGTRFPDFMTLQCSRCKATYSSAKHIDAHHCP